MKPTDQLKQWEWIDAYHQGILAPDEQELFEQELVRDAAFRRTADQLLAADVALKQWGLEQTVRQAIQQELYTNRPQRRWRLTRRAGVLLVSSLLCLVAYLSLSRVDLKDYQNDITLIQRYRASGPDANGTALTPQQRDFYRYFFDAQAFLANGQPELAIKNLEKLARMDSLRPYFRQAVQWHLLNAYLLNKQSDNAETTLRLLDQAKAAVYPISRVDRWKVWCQIHWQKIGD